MSLITFLYRYVLRRGTTANLASVNEIPLDSEAVRDTDTGRVKIGDGVTHYNSLPFHSNHFFAEGSGTNTITATFSNPPVYYDGLQIRVRAAGANTGAVTFNPNGAGALDVKKLGGVALVAGEISGAGHELILRYRSSVPRWELLNPAVVASGGTGGIGMTLIGTATVTGAAATTLTLSGVNFSLYKAFKICFKFNNATGSAASLSLYYNSDTTATNYEHEGCTFTGTTVSASRVNDGIFDSLPANEPLVGWIDLLVDGDGRTRSLCIGNRDALSGIVLRINSPMWTTATNVTSVTISSSVASALSIGDTFSLWGIS